jgi:CBS domain-containing protein
MEDDLPIMTPDTALTEALGALVKHEADRLPIVGPDRKLLGEITKSDVLLALG